MIERQTPRHDPEPIRLSPIVVGSWEQLRNKWSIFIAAISLSQISLTPTPSPSEDNDATNNVGRLTPESFGGLFLTTTGLSVGAFLMFQLPLLYHSYFHVVKKWAMDFVRRRIGSSMKFFQRKMVQSAAIHPQVVLVPVALGLVLNTCDAFCCYDLNSVLPCASRNAKLHDGSSSSMVCCRLVAMAIMGLSLASFWGNGYRLRDLPSRLIPHAGRSVQAQ
ncbi:hypothetical protein V6N11_024824 [Hibiscus sabdariffa]|uniref:Uncharacterized protein n=1 Tax=Hibiscus sabdariffa TaxID=183260 RepID=A0ABR2QNS4_9ROSI